jgi:hypothetical protein
MASSCERAIRAYTFAAWRHNCVQHCLLQQANAYVVHSVLRLWLRTWCDVVHALISRGHRYSARKRTRALYVCFYEWLNVCKRLCNTDVNGSRESETDMHARSQRTHTHQDSGSEIDMHARSQCAYTRQDSGSETDMHARVDEACTHACTVTQTQTQTEFTPDSDSELELGDDASYKRCCAYAYRVLTQLRRRSTLRRLFTAWAQTRAQNTHQAHMCAYMRHRRRRVCMSASIHAWRLATRRPLYMQRALNKKIWRVQSVCIHVWRGICRERTLIRANKLTLRLRSLGDVLATGRRRLYKRVVHTWRAYVSTFGSHVRQKHDHECVRGALHTWREFAAEAAHIQYTHIHEYAMLLERMLTRWKNQTADSRYCVHTVHQSLQTRCVRDALFRWCAYAQKRAYGTRTARICAYMHSRKCTNLKQRALLIWGYVLVRKRIAQSGCCYDPMPAWAAHMQKVSFISSQHARTKYSPAKKRIFAPLRPWSDALRWYAGKVVKTNGDGSVVNNTTGGPNDSSYDVNSTPLVNGNNTPWGSNKSENYPNVNSNSNSTPLVNGNNTPRGSTNKSENYPDVHERRLVHAHVHAHPARVRRLCARALLGDGVAGGGDKARLMMIFACWAARAYICTSAKHILGVTLP